MGHRMWRMLSQGFQQAVGPLHVGVKSFKRRVKTGLGETLCGEMEYIVRVDLPHDSGHRQAVAEVTIYKRHAVLRVNPVEKVRDVVQRAPPADHTADVPVRICQQEVSEVRPYHAGKPGYERAFLHETSLFSSGDHPPQGVLESKIRFAAQ